MVLNVMAKEELIEMQGVVDECCPTRDSASRWTTATADRLHRRQDAQAPHPHLAGDNVSLELSPYDLTKGRITFRHESIEHRDAAWEDQLALLVHRLSRTPRSLAADHYVPNPDWEALHRDFHRSLLARCPSRWLRAFCDSLADEAYRFRQLAAGRVFSSRNEHAEHVAIFDAAIHGRTDEALRGLTEHYTRTAQVVAQQAPAPGHAP
jgi:hypothetical protein